jgi:hypothetical protein
VKWRKKTTFSVFDGSRKFTAARLESSSCSATPLASVHGEMLPPSPHLPILSRRRTENRQETVSSFRRHALPIAVVTHRHHGHAPIRVNAVRVPADWL